MIIKKIKMDKRSTKRVVVVADGSFPSHEIPLGYLADAEVIVCCDGSAEKVVKAGYIPSTIVGDMDSLSIEMKNRFADRIFEDKEQETNDLTKAVKWCRKSGYPKITIIGATGMREDHTIGNISLLAEYMRDVDVKIVTDFGVFIPLKASRGFDCAPGQQVSIFSIGEGTVINTEGLKYPLKERILKNWWEATLNETVANSFTIEFRGGPVIIYLNHQTIR
jgi:thiamine pyrophosphokinase